MWMSGRQSRWGVAWGSNPVKREKELKELGLLSQRELRRVKEDRGTRGGTGAQLQERRVCGLPIFQA